MTKGWRRWRKPVIDIGVITLLLVALSHLPPDTSLSERVENGILRLCVPDRSSELIRADDATQPGYELALMQGVAQDLDLRLQVVEIANMGRSFNPRDWQIGRGQCDILGGGLADSAANRGFLTLLPNGGRIGLVRIGDSAPPARGAKVGVFMGSAGLNRVQLSSWMRAEGWQPHPLATKADLAVWLRQGSEAIASSLTPLPAGTLSHDLPAAAGESTSLAFGLWRGDVTLTHAIRAALQKEIQHKQFVARAN